MPRFDVVRELEGVPEEVPSEVVPPEPLASDREGLAGEPSANKVNRSHKSALISPLPSGCHVVMLRNVRPMLLKDGPRVLVDLYLADAVPAGLLEAEVETPDFKRQRREIRTSSA